MPYNKQLYEKVYSLRNQRILPISMSVGLEGNSPSSVKSSDDCSPGGLLDYSLMRDLSQNLPAKLLPDY